MKPLAAMLAVALACTALAADGQMKVINYRNGGTGAYPDADPPLEWSVTKNVRWRWDAPLFGTTIASPIIVGERIITLAKPMTLVCLDKNTGKVLWRRERYLSPDAHDGLLRAEEGNIALTMHQAILRDHRISELEQLLGRTRGPGALWKEVQGLRAVKGERFSEEDLAFYAARAATIEVALKQAEADTDTLAAELDHLLAEAPDPKDKGAIRVVGRLCSSTPASDGERVYAIFSPGLLVCTDLEGKTLWAHAVVGPGGRLAKPSWGCYAEVPVCADGKVVVPWGDQVHCLEAASGNVVWQDEADGAHCAASPVIAEAGGRYYVGMADGQVRSLADGTGVFTTDLSESKPLGSPLYAQRATSRDHRTIHYVAFALRLTGDPARPVHMLWRLPPDRLDFEKRDRVIYGGSHQYCAPAVHGGIVYYLCTHNKRFLSALDAETGQVIYGPQVGVWTATYSDLTLAGEHLFVFNGGRGHEGICLVLKAGRRFEVVRENALERIVANNPVFEGRRMYLRTVRGLWCIEKRATP